MTDDWDPDAAPNRERYLAWEAKQKQEHDDAAKKDAPGAPRTPVSDPAVDEASSAG